MAVSACPAGPESRSETGTSNSNGLVLKSRDMKLALGSRQTRKTEGCAKISIWERW